MKLENKVVLVTGASSGIRNEIAKLIAKEGASVVVVAKRNENLENLVKQIETNGGQAITVEGDLNPEEKMQTAFNAALSKFGKLDIVINSAGIADIIAPVADMGEGIWEVDLKVDLTGAI
ncbi:SDR family NAD(P)-dependent oxidoreductase [Methanobacterium sp.]|uniref:SDR family NAD(P)-dependent oxidoreductase n=1 Tax=Methanobacterium sp. TaxID=2164 RepID=UPI0025FC8252|nr:SDR family NAD(P)-dependent oxidoreductase [Methanobacterium sp.]MBI5458392.1 SDR family NAD(P)-dependent oxidoreductase [Methanobacterium sp.]